MHPETNPALTLDPPDALRTSQPLRLPAELTIYTFAETRSAWLPWLTSQLGGQRGDSALVDAGAVDQVDAAGVQLLASLALALTPRHLQLVAPSEPLRSACLTLGLGALLAEAGNGACA